MKKILSFMVMLAVVFSLTACKEKEWKEPTDDTTFEEWLDANVNELDSDKIDEMINLEELNLSTDRISEIALTALSVELEASGDAEVADGAMGTLWQEDSVIYLYAEADGEEVLASVDLDDLTDLAEEAAGEYEAYLEMTPSELINMALEASGADMDLDDLLDLVELDIDYFEEKGDDVYEFKLEAIGEIVENAAEKLDIDLGEMDGDAIVKMIEDMFDELTIELTYNNGKVRNIRTAFELAQDPVEAAGFYSVSFGYGPEGVNSLEVESEMDLDVNGQTISYKVKSFTGEKEASVEMSIESDFVNATVNLSANEEKIEGEGEIVVENGGTITYTIDVALKEEWIEEGTITFAVESEDPSGVAFEVTATLAGGDNVELPDVDTDDAMDLMEMAMGGMGSADQVYPY